jgi:hypothetical protein
MQRESRTRPAGGARTGVAALVLTVAILADTAWAQSTSVHPFRIEDTIVNQCTGEAVTIVLEGRIVARPSFADGVHRYSILSELHGSATGAGVRYRFVGTEAAEFESETPATQLSIWNNVRMVTRRGEPAYLGYDEQTISIDEAGTVQHVAHRFDFACD